MLGITLQGLVPHPGGSRNTPSHFMLTETGDKRRPDEPLGLYANFTYLFSRVEVG